MDGRRPLNGFKQPFDAVLIRERLSASGTSALTDGPCELRLARPGDLPGPGARSAGAETRTCLGLTYGKRRVADDRPAGQPVVYVLVRQALRRGFIFETNDRWSTHIAPPWGVAGAARSALTARRTVTSARISRLPGEDGVAAAAVKSGHGLSSFASLGPISAHIRTETPERPLIHSPCPQGVTCGPPTPHSRRQRTAPADVQPRRGFRSNPYTHSDPIRTPFRSFRTPRGAAP